MSLAQLKPEGKAHLDELLRKLSTAGNIPAVFFSATNAKETIYENQDGLVKFGEESSGKVAAETSMYLITKIPFRIN